MKIILTLQSFEMTFIHIISQQIIQMGNSLHAEQQDWRHVLSPATTDPRYDYLTHWRNANGDLFLARQIELPEHLGLQNLKRRLQNRENRCFNSSCIYPLDQCYFQHTSSLCSQQERCLLTCVKPKNNLEKSFEERRLAGSSFSIEEINLTLNSICKALKVLFESGEPFCPLRMSHIAISDNVYLMDPILIENDPFGYGSTGEYPSPEQLHEEGVLQGLKQSKLPIQLFSLGIIGLQLYHSMINVKEIYQRYHKYGSIISINTQKLNELLINVSDNYLRAKIATLTNFNAQSRQNIYTFIDKESSNAQSIQAISTQLQNYRLNNPAPLSPFVKEKKNEPALKELKYPVNNTYSPLLKHQHLQKQKHLEEKATNKPKVSINFVSKIHNNTLPYQSCLPSVKKNITFSHASQQMASQVVRRNNENNNDQTPIRTKQRHNFSTIKEVSEYDECASTSRMKSFEDVSLHGKYEGDLKAGKRHGKGIFYFQEGSIYDGEWKDDQMHGFGNLYYPSGKLAYEGQWKYNEFSGKGRVFNDEPIHMGQPFDFTDFNQLGQEWIYYEGNLLQDQRQGEGCLKLSNGEQLRGNFSEDKVHGLGSFLTLSGQTIRGIWNESILERTFNQ